MPYSPCTSLPEDPREKVLGVNSRLFFAVIDAGLISFIEIFLAKTPTFIWIYPWWGALPVFTTVYIPFFLADTYNDATQSWSSTSISGVGAVTGAPVPPYTAGSCSDGNECTTDTCNLELGCEYIDNTDPCDDGDACTEADECSGGVCQPGGPLDCDDHDGCTPDACDDLQGCTHDPIPGCGVVPVSSGSRWDRALLGLLMAGIGARLLRTRHRAARSCTQYGPRP